MRCFGLINKSSALRFHVPSNALLILVALTVHEVAQRLVCTLAVEADAHDFQQRALCLVTEMHLVHLRVRADGVSR